MTAQLNTSDFMYDRIPTPQDSVFMRPNVADHFWGFEVRPNEHVINIAVLMRAFAVFFAAAMFIASLGVWLMPAMAFVGAATSAKLTVSILLMLAAIVIGRIAARGTRVRVQFDTSTGELREVVDRVFSGGQVLARYSLDTVEAVEIVENRENRGFGQVQIRLRGAGIIPAGDGAVSALSTLRSRIAHDCGLEIAGSKREAVWSGPLAA